MRLLRRVAVVLASGLLAAGCATGAATGSGQATNGKSTGNGQTTDGRTTGSAPATGGSRVKAAAWARSVCTALSPWRTRLATLSSRTQSQLTSTTTPADAKRNLIGLLDGAATASETARRGVAGAGTPDVDHGADIATRFVRSLAATRDAYAHARTTVAGLDPSDAHAFYTAVGTAFGTLQNEYAASALDVDKLSSAPLRTAFNEVPECH
jgi:hypothetical protein